MEHQEIPSGLKITFLAHAIITGLVGLQHLLAPRIWTDLAGMEIEITVTWRVIGAALIGFSVSSWLAFRERTWDRVRITVVMEVVWSVIAALVILWAILREGAPPLEWVNVALLALFAVLFTRLYALAQAG